MKKPGTIILIVCILILSGSYIQSIYSSDKVTIYTSHRTTDMHNLETIKTIDQLDISRYMGKWYEIARYPNSFENGLINVSAEYKLLDNGKIDVTNSGYKDGKIKTIKGKAKQPDPRMPGRLKVSFFLWFYSDYNIIYLDKEYKNAVVSGAKNRYLWILSRDQNIKNEELDAILTFLKRNGIETEKLVYANNR